jgi:Na+/H+ antiporter NhaD/arsenite permease-like protein
MSAPASATAVSAGVTFLHAGLLTAMVAALALEEKLHAKKSVITGVAAVLALLLGAFTHVLPESHGHVPFYIGFIDWGVIAVILGSSLFVDTATKSGIFSWLAIRITKLTKGDPFRLLASYGVMTVLFSALLNNVTAMIIIGSLTAVSLRKLGREKLLLGFLLCEGLLTNIGGLLTLISSVPNIIVGNTAGITFFRFFVVSAPYVVVATAITIFMAARLFGVRPLESSEERDKAAALIETFDENDGIESHAFFVMSWVVFALFILTLATTSVLPFIRDLGIGFVAMAFGVMFLMKVKSEADQTYRSIDWDLLLFFCFLFVVIGVAEHAKVLDLIGKGVVGLMKLGENGGPAALLWASSIASSVTDNIPLAAMLAKTMSKIADPAPLANTSNYWWAVIYGANLGGNITPIGSASTLVAVTIIHKNKLELSFAGFVKKAVPFALVQLALASVYVFILGKI